MGDFFILVLAGIIIAIIVYMRRLKGEIRDLREAVVALIGEMRARGLDDVVDNARENANAVRTPATVHHRTPDATDALQNEPVSAGEEQTPQAEPIPETEPQAASVSAYDAADAKKTISLPQRPREPRESSAPKETWAAKIARTVGLANDPPGDGNANEAIHPDASQYDAPAPLGQRIEELIGGKLPIWVGGISLIFAGFFLVRYSIEAGLLGPSVRVVLAAIFGTMLLAASEAGRVWPILAEDKRLGQSLAGAGIAILYGTLYMAGELYGLIGPVTAFILLAIVTIAALALSLKHGAPTAIMGLLGGFAAPYVAGLGPESAGPLLLYLAIFTAGLFALSIHRGWMWLAMLATGGSVLWSTALMISGVGNAGPILGIFIVALAIAGVISLEKIAKRQNGDGELTRPALGKLLRMSPVAIGLIQLAIFAPLLDFTLMGWLFYAALSVFALVMAWRDPALTPAPIGALILSLVMLAGAISNGEDITAAAVIAVAIAVLFGAPGQWLAFRQQDGAIWSIMALAAPSGAFAVPFLTAYGSAAPGAWGAYALLAALPALYLAWRAGMRWQAREKTGAMPHIFFRNDAVLIMATLTAALLALVPAFAWPPVIFIAAAILLIAAALELWGKHVDNDFIREASLAAIILAAAIWGLAQFEYNEFATAAWLDGDMPPMRQILAFAVLPAALLAALTWFKNDLHSRRLLPHWLAFICGAAGVVAVVPFDLHAIAYAAMALAAGAPMVRKYLPEHAVPALLIPAALFIAAALFPFAEICIKALTGEYTAHYAQLPVIMPSIKALIIPGALLGAIWWLNNWMPAQDTRAGSARWMPVLGGLVAIVGAAVAYLLLKQPLAIDTDAAFLSSGFFERAMLTQLLFAGGYVLLRPGLLGEFIGKHGHKMLMPALVMLTLAALRFIYFDLLLLNPLVVAQHVGPVPVANLLTGHLALTAIWIYLLAKLPAFASFSRWLMGTSLVLTLMAALASVKQAMHGSLIADSGVGTTENYLYSAVLIILASIWLWRGIVSGSALLRIAGLLTLTLVTFKVFLIDAAALEGILRILSFLGLGFALIGIGWVYSRVMGSGNAPGR